MVAVLDQLDDAALRHQGAVSCTSPIHKAQPDVTASKASASSTGSGARAKASRVMGGTVAATGTAVTIEALCMVNRQRNRHHHAKN